ncbi:GspH/FimT family pseudopilin [Motiliproteus sediminis]|uniref:GspH/FimT family pseudopilin n=1 Tax=Motiliproteus sediminis TaxID=1468178 RepID=UPI001AEF930D|nr:GspH/FimT family pseudopilin [Motiliproteus sediminis]
MDRDGRCYRRRRSTPASGFTLTELLIVLAITTVVMTLGVGSFNYYIGSTQADTIINRLRTALSLARAEAVKRSASVVLCRQSAVPGSCAGGGATGRLDWSEGWLLFVDHNHDRIFDLGAGDELLRVFPAIEAAFVLKWNRGDFIAYQGSGSLNSLNGTFCLGDYEASTAFSRELVIPYSGRVRATQGACSYALLP